MDRSRSSLAAKIATLSAVILGVSFGLCGITAIAASNSGAISRWKGLGILGYIVAAGMALGVIGLITAGVIATWHLLFSSRKSTAPQRLFPNGTDEDDK